MPKHLQTIKHAHEMQGRDDIKVVDHHRHACHMRRRIHACHMRRRIHACHIKVVDHHRHKPRD